MTDQIITTIQDQSTELSIPQSAAEAADRAASKNSFSTFRKKKSVNTRKAHDVDLARFADFLAHAGIYPTLPNDDRERKQALDAHVTALNDRPQAWHGVSFGIVEAFVAWQVNNSYAISSINRSLSTVKKYAGLAYKAGALDADTFAKIKLVTGYSRKEGINLDEDREERGIDTRTSAKKAEAVKIPAGAEDALKLDHDDMPQGRRDAVLMSLLLDLGLRAGEAAGLKVRNVDLEAGQLTFYREKVAKTQTHNMTPALLKAMRAYLPYMPLMADDKLLRRSIKGGKLGKPGISARSLTYRVQSIGERHGIEGLSAHDCRHHWATTAARNGTPLDRLMDAGGWSSPAMPMRYIEAARIANEGVKLSS